MKIVCLECSHDRFEWFMELFSSTFRKNELAYDIYKCERCGKRIKVYI